MSELHLPWLEISILLPLIGSLIVSLVKDRDAARGRCVLICSLTLVCAVGEWLDFGTLHVFEAHDHWDMLEAVFHKDIFVIDELSAPLLPLAALLYLLTVLATVRTKVDRFTFGWALFSEALLLATLACKEPWGIISLLILSSFPPFFELLARGKSARVYVIHMSAFTAFLIAGQALHDVSSTGSFLSVVAVLLLALAALIRSGIAPLHCWMTDLFEKATFGTALLYVTPMAGSYAAMRLVLPVAPDWILRAVALVALTTAVYSACMALVQTEARRFFCYLFLSHSSLVLVGLELVTPIGLTGALCVWLSVGMSLAGFGLTLRAVEARTGQLLLTKFHGLYEHIPTLAAFFLLTGLASIGFPGTIGFVGAELVLEGAVEVFPAIGFVVVLAAALNGIAIMQAYFRIFTGAHNPTSVALSARPRERFAVLLLTLLILGGGFFPQPGVRSRYHAAIALLAHRGVNATDSSSNPTTDSHKDTTSHSETSDETSSVHP
jgi:NADH-quinone oxidoreductase subunit M